MFSRGAVCFPGDQFVFSRGAVVVFTGCTFGVCIIIFGHVEAFSCYQGSLVFVFTGGSVFFPESIFVFSRGAVCFSRGPVCVFTGESVFFPESSLCFHGVQLWCSQWQVFLFSRGPVFCFHGGQFVFSIIKAHRTHQAFALRLLGCKM